MRSRKRPIRLRFRGALETAGGITGAKLFVACDATAPTYPQFQECSTLGAELRLGRFFAPILGILTGDAARGVRKNLQTLWRDRLVADLAEGGLLPIVLSFGLVFRTQQQTREAASVALEPREVDG
jgi:hypothetical protein